MLEDQKTENEFFDSPEYHLNEKFMTVVGSWPYLSPKKKKTICDDERKIFATYANYGKILSIVFTVCYYLVGVIYIVSPLIPSASHYRVTGDWIAPIRNVLEVEFFIDPVNYYWKLYVLLVHMCMGVVSLHLANDSFFVMVVLHCCGMFAVLRYKVEQMNKEMIVHGYSCNQQLAVKRIKEIVMYHLECLDCQNDQPQFRHLYSGIQNSIILHIQFEATFFQLLKTAMSYFTMIIQTP
uniref:Odorant receptor n=1 Tax=Trichogramma kaykai TaxID=54128 RepID=A0ABD2XL20_9HYME